MPHQSADWFAMTVENFPLLQPFNNRHPPHSGMLAGRDCRWDSARFWHESRLKAAGILCVFQGFHNAELGQKIRCSRGNTFQKYAQLKRERGELCIHPAVAPVSLKRAIIPFVFSPTDLHLGGQNLAALGTTAGQNLTAVGSSHSLTETVNLGTMTLGGLIGTLHNYTSCFFNQCSTAVLAAATHIKGL